jgi:hypothetical protein
MRSNPFAAARAQRIRIRAERAKVKLRSEHDVAPDEYLSGRPPKPPRPRFRVQVTDDPSKLPSSPSAKRKHQKTGAKPSGRQPLKNDVFLGAEVYKLMRTARISETEAIKRVAARLGDHIDPKNARERVYRSLDRYRAAMREREQSGWGLLFSLSQQRRFFQ